jgi:hypothetical protein
MELPAFDRQASMADPHNLALAGRVIHPSRHLEATRQGGRFDDERMIAGCDEGIVEPGKHPSIIVVNAIGFPVHQLRRTNNPSPKGLPDGLMA